MTLQNLLRNIWIKLRKRPENNKTQCNDNNEIVVLIDWPNIFLNMKSKDPQNFNVKARIENLLEWIKKIGRIKIIFVFTPRNLTIGNEELFLQFGFIQVLCPIITEESQNRDTTDDYLITVGKECLGDENISHLCLVSGDSDFIPLLERTKAKGIKIGIIAASNASLSASLIKYADFEPKIGGNMLYIIPSL